MTEKGAATMVARMRPAWCDIDLDALASNAAALHAHAGVPLLPMVKADAYGHGVGAVARRLAGVDGVWGLGVALVREAEDLRAEGWEGRILVLGGLLPEEAAEVVETGAFVALSDLPMARALSAAAGARLVTVHLKVDVGMHRLGVPFDEAEAAAAEIAGLPGISLEGLLTHLAAAHAGDEASQARTQGELDRFLRLAEVLHEKHGPLLLHAANSSAILSHGQGPFDLARPGMALYGWRPADWLPTEPALAPVLSVRARVAVVKRAEEGGLVGYSQTPVEAGRRLGVLPIGYGDGIPQAWGLNGGYVRFASGRAPIIGSVCMDSLVVDLTGLPSEGEGSTALLLGSGPEGTVLASELAASAGRIPYEILTGLTARLPRNHRP